MRKNYFTEEEIILCAYAALYNEADVGGINGIHQLTRRSRSSISMKIRNIVAKLDEEHIPRNHRFTPLTGVTQGKSGRPTNWDVVASLTRKPQKDFQAQCQIIIARAAKADLIEVIDERTRT